MVAAKSFLCLKVLVFRLRADRFHSSLAVGAVRLPRLPALRSSRSFQETFPRSALAARFHRAYHALEDLTRQQIVA